MTPYDFILIPGRTTKQGCGISEGKFGENYQSEIHTLQINPADMQRLGLVENDRVIVTSEHGQIEVAVKAAAADELPEGLLFIAYGDLSSRLMGGATHGSGMPTSKGLDVRLEVASRRQCARTPVNKNKKTKNGDTSALVFFARLLRESGPTSEETARTRLQVSDKADRADAPESLRTELDGASLRPSRLLPASATSAFYPYPRRSKVKRRERGSAEDRRVDSELCRTCHRRCRAVRR